MSKFKELVDMLSPEDDATKTASDETNTPDLDSDQLNKIANLVYNKVMDDLEARKMDKTANDKLASDLLACGDRLSEGFLQGLQKRAANSIKPMNTARTDGGSAPGPSAGSSGSKIRAKLQALDKHQSISTTGGNTMVTEGESHPSASEHPAGNTGTNSPIVWNRSPQNAYKKD